MTYSQKLRDPRWQKLRLQIMQRDGFRCIFCDSSTKTLHVHHIVYKRRDPWDYPEYLYQTMCEDCHQERQELTDKAVDAVRISVSKVPTRRLVEAVRKLCSGAMLEIEVEK